jgi:hypothetical protein
MITFFAGVVLGPLIVVLLFIAILRILAGVFS